MTGHFVKVIKTKDDIFVSAKELVPCIRALASGMHCLEDSVRAECFAIMLEQPKLESEL